MSHLSLLVESSLSVVIFEHRGWTLADSAVWSARLLEEHFAFVPSRHQGRPFTRFAVVNPLTTEDDLAMIIDSMR